MIFLSTFLSYVGNSSWAISKSFRSLWGSSFREQEQVQFSFGAGRGPLPMPSLIRECSPSPALPGTCPETVLVRSKGEERLFPQSLSLLLGRAQEVGPLLSPQERGLPERDSWQIGAPSTDGSVPYTKVSFKIKISLQILNTHTQSSKSNLPLILKKYLFQKRN